MTVEGAVIREQGVTFGILIVKPSALTGPRGRKDALVAEASRLFGQIPAVLMSQDGSGRARFYGGPDLVRFMARVPLSRVPWKRYRLAA